jgi:hypothetical protein
VAIVTAAGGIFSLIVKRWCLMPANWSNDHEPPHFHARRAGEWEVKVHFLLEPAEMIEVVWAASRRTSANSQIAGG